MSGESNIGTYPVYTKTGKRLFWFLAELATQNGDTSFIPKEAGQCYMAGGHRVNDLWLNEQGSISQRFSDLSIPYYMGSKTAISNLDKNMRLIGKTLKFFLSAYVRHNFMPRSKYTNCFEALTSGELSGYGDREVKLVKVPYGISSRLLFDTNIINSIRYADRLPEDTYDTFTVNELLCYMDFFNGMCRPEKKKPLVKKYGEAVFMKMIGEQESNPMSGLVIKSCEDDFKKISREWEESFSQLREEHKKRLDELREQEEINYLMTRIKTSGRIIKKIEKILNLAD
jgi:hypothetical protein